MYTFISGGITVAYANLCTQKDYSILTKLLVSLCLSIALILPLFSDKMLIKEPAAQNPFKLIYQVKKYAINKNNQDARVLSHTAERTILLTLTWVKTNMEDPLQ